MNIKLKAFLIALPAAIILQAITLLAGIWFFGESFHVPSTNIIGVATGFIVFNIVIKKQTRKNPNSSTEK